MEVTFSLLYDGGDKSDNNKKRAVAGFVKASTYALYRSDFIHLNTTELSVKIQDNGPSQKAWLQFK